MFDCFVLGFGILGVFCLLLWCLVVVMTFFDLCCVITGCCLVVLLDCGVVLGLGWLLFWFGVLFVGFGWVCYSYMLMVFVFITLLVGWFCVVVELAMFLF